VVFSTINNSQIDQGTSPSRPNLAERRRKKVEGEKSTRRCSLIADRTEESILDFSGEINVSKKMTLL